MEQYAQSASQCFRKHLSIPQLRDFSSKLQEQFKEKLSVSDISMLPSYTYGMPHGREHGRFLALDVGGSTLRVALVQLHGKVAGTTASYSIEQRVYKIDHQIRNLEGQSFFDWVARGISETLGVEGKKPPAENPAIPLGVAWSFPVEQISLRDALLLQMGKAFRVTDTHLRHNLADLIENACHKIGLNIHVEAIVNDSAAILLAQTYCEGAAGVAYILGTGMNAAIELPIQAFGPQKFDSVVNGMGSGTHTTSEVLVNTELSMFGGNVFPLTPWDMQLREHLPRPDFQPLEHLSSGRYIGEIIRLTLVEAIQNSHLFGGETPAAFGPYEIETSAVSGLETNDVSLLEKAAVELETRHPLRNKRAYSTDDILQIRQIVESVSDRAAAYVAVSMHALWSLKLDLERKANVKSEGQQLFVSCNGSVIVKYPRFKERVQGYVDLMIGVKEDAPQPLVLEVAGREESVLVGAAVAVAAGRSEAVKQRARI